MPLFELPGLAMSVAFGGVTQQQAIRMKESYERMKAVSDQLSGALRKAYVSGAQGAASYGSKVIDIANDNATSVFDFWSGLMDTKSPTEFMNLSAAQARKSLVAGFAQNHELWSVAQRAARESLTPSSAHDA